MFKEAIHNAFGKPNSPSHGFVISPTAKFLALDTDAISKELGISEAAVLRGRQDLPKTDSDFPDEVERKIVQKIEGIRKDTCDDYDGEMKAYEMRLSSVNFQSRVSEMTATALRADSDFKTTVQHAFLELDQLRKERDQAEADLNGFRDQNRLRRDAQLPHKPPFVSWSIIFLVLAVDTVFNGMFFGERVEGGLVQGFGEAIVFAFLNVACGYIIGRYGITKLLHVNPSDRAVGAIITLAFVIAMMTNNLFAAHYRFVLVTNGDVERATIIAFENIKRDILGVGDLKSWWLMAIGLAAAIVAGRDGWSMDDPYPGYGAKTRTYRARVDEFLSTKKDLMHQLTEDRDSASDYMRSSLKFLDASLNEYRGLLGARKKLYESFCTYLNDLEMTANHLLSSYRQKNIESRKAPPPGSFKEAYKITRPILQEPPSHEQDIRELSAILQTVSAEMTAQDAAIHDSHDAAITRINEIV